MSYSTLYKAQFYYTFNSGLGGGRCVEEIFTQTMGLKNYQVEI